MVIENVPFATFVEQLLDVQRVDRYIAISSHDFDPFALMLFHLQVSEDFDMRKA